MFGSRSMDIGLVWPSWEGTWTQWAPKKLLQLLAHAAVCVLSTTIFFVGICLQIEQEEHESCGGVPIVLDLVTFGIFFVGLPIAEFLSLLLIVGCIKLLFDLLESLRHLLKEVIVFGCFLALSYFQSTIRVFEVTAGLQIFGFCMMALSEDFDTPLKLWIKSNFSKEIVRFLASFLKLKYFQCSNPIEKKVFRTHLFLTTGKLLNTTGFELGNFTELDNSRPRDKVTATPAGLGHTLFKIEGISVGVLVENSPRLNEQKEILEHLAHNPAACFVKEVHESRGKYCPIEEYSDLLGSSAIYACRFSQNAAVFGKLERDIGLFSWVGSSGRIEKALRLTSRCLSVFAQLTGLYSPLESSPLYQRNLYLYGFLGFGLNISFRKYTPADGLLML